MMFKVIEAFVDLYDEGYIYRVGDTYPRQGATPSKERLEELSSNQNRCGLPVIVEEHTEETPSVAPESVEDVEAGVGPSVNPEAEKKPRKGQKQRVGTDS